MATQPAAIGGEVEPQPHNDWHSYFESVKVGKSWMPFVNVTDYGAVGDYDPSTGTGTDNTAAFNAAIADAKEMNGVVLVPEGLYKITGALDVTEGEFYGCLIIGENVEATKIISFVTGTTPIFSYKGGSGAFSNVGLRNITMEPDSSVDKQGTAIYIDGQDFGIFDNVRIKNFNYGLWLHNQTPGNFTEINQFDNVQIDYCNENIRMEQGDGDASFHGNNFDNVLMNIGPNQVGFNHVSGYYYNGRFNFLMWAKDSSSVYFNADGNTEKTMGSFTYEGDGLITGSQRFWFYGHMDGLGTITDNSTRAGTGIDEHQQVFRCNNYNKALEYGNTGLNVESTSPFASYDSPMGYLHRLTKSGVDSILVNTYNGSTENGFYIGSTGYQQSVKDGIMAWFLSSVGDKLKSYNSFFEVDINGVISALFDANSVDFKGGIKNKFRKITGAYTVTENDKIILADASSGSYTVTLPDSTTVTGLTLTIKRIEGSANTVTIEGNGTQTIDGSTSKTLNAWQDQHLISDGVNWYTLTY